MGGLELGGTEANSKVEWYNEQFEICDPHTSNRRLMAQPQSRPFRTVDVDGQPDALRRAAALWEFGIYQCAWSLKSPVFHACGVSVFRVFGLLRQSSAARKAL